MGFIAQEPFMNRMIFTDNLAMNLFLPLVILFLSLTVSAQEIVYTDASFKMSPLEHSHKLNEFFKEEGFVALADSQHGIPSLGINQVYFKEEGEFVMVKYGLEGDFPLQQIIKTPDGAYMIHDKVGSNKFFMYFRGINEYAVKLTLSKIKNKIVTYSLPSFSSFFIPEAHAQQDCGSPQLIAQMTDFANLSGTMVWNFARNCVSGLGQGAWASTGGAVSSTISSVWNAVTNPVETADRIGRSVYNFTVGLARFIRGVVTDPRGTIQRLGASAGNAWNGMVDTVSSMTTAMKIQFICSFIGSLGVDAAIALFTGGAGAARLGARLAQIAGRFALISRTMSLLAGLSGSARAALGMTSAKMRNLMNRLMSGQVRNGDLRALEDLGRADRDLSIRTLACYI